MHERIKLTCVAAFLAASLLGCAEKEAEVQEQTLEQACPQVTETETVLIASNLYIDLDSGPIYRVYGEMNGNGGFADSNTSPMQLIENLNALGSFPEDSKSHVHILISSSGGSANSGLATAEAIEYYGSDKVTAVCLGNASSAASHILAAAGLSYGNPNCDITTHAVFSDHAHFYRDDSEHIKNIKKTYTPEYIEDAIINNNNSTLEQRKLYQRHTGLSDQCVEFLTRSDRDTFLRGREALLLGFLDAVIRPNGQIEIRKGEEHRFPPLVFTPVEQQPKPAPPAP